MRVIKTATMTVVHGNHVAEGVQERLEPRLFDKMNKYKQNSNTREANRRKRRWTRRAVISPARVVQMLSISNVSSDILDAIDELAARQDRSRSSFIRRELQRIVDGHRAKAA